MSVVRVPAALLQAQRRGTRRRVPRRFDWADDLLFQITALKLPEPLREFAPFVHRKFRLDLAWPDRSLFVECDGGEYVKGSKNRHGGATDCERWNLLTASGWKGYRFVGSQIKSGYAIKTIEDALRDGQG